MFVFLARGQTISGVMKLNDIDLLSHVYQTAEMGRDGIRSVLKYSRDAVLNKTLLRQEEEYRRLQDAAEELIRAHGMMPEGVGAMAKLSSEMMSTVKTMADPSATKIAEMMIQGSTMGVTKSLRTIRDCQGAEKGSVELAERLLKTEQANIEELKAFL